ncbi:hypothetical protein ACIFOT_05595 [Neobacillus sp. NRS-1170]|uniref:hypothetical protein n=1 Tax=Neobacillus sp. NRS-1170 TaxID=3233898 RepID=UPI003D2E3F68
MDKNWSIALEHGEYETDQELVIKDAIDAVKNFKRILCQYRHTCKLWQSWSLFNKRVNIHI